MIVINGELSQINQHFICSSSPYLFARWRLAGTVAFKWDTKTTERGTNKIATRQQRVKKSNVSKYIETIHMHKWARTPSKSRATHFLATKLITPSHISFAQLLQFFIRTRARMFQGSNKSDKKWRIRNTHTAHKRKKGRRSARLAELFTSFPTQRNNPFSDYYWYWWLQSFNNIFASASPRHIAPTAWLHVPQNLIVHFYEQCSIKVRTTR